MSEQEKFGSVSGGDTIQAWIHRQNIRRFEMLRNEAKTSDRALIEELLQESRKKLRSINAP